MAEDNTNTEAVLPDDVLEALLDATAPVEPPPERAQSMRGRILERIRTRPAEPTVGEMLTVSAAGGEWIEVMPGNEIKMLRPDKDTQSFLVRLHPGTTFPSHFHAEDEETYVLEGEAWFGDTPLKAGDYHLARKGTTHGEVRTDTGCLLFIRAATPEADG